MSTRVCIWQGWLLQPLLGACAPPTNPPSLPQRSEMESVALLSDLEKSSVQRRRAHILIDRHIVSLDGLRGIAVILTQLSHIVKRDHVHFKHSSARAGVAIFFVLSGYLITGVLLRLEVSICAYPLQSRPTEETDTVRCAKRKYRSPSSSRMLPSYRHLVRFYMDRSVRLFPALVVMLITTICIKFFFYGVPDSDALRVLARDAFYCLTYTTNFGRIANLESEGGMWQNAWSLAVEEQFYIVWSTILPLMMLVGKRWQLIVMASMTMASLFVKYSEFRNVLHLSIWIQHWTGPLGNVWKMLLGASLCLFPLPACLQTRWLSYFALAPLATLQMHAWFAGKWSWKPIPPTLFYETASTFAAVPIIASVVAHESRILCTPALVFIGRISYSFYLYQVPLLTIAARPGGGWPRGYLGFAITALASLSAAASTIFVEEPIRRTYRQRMSKSPTKPERTETSMRSVHVVT